MKNKFMASQWRSRVASIAVALGLACPAYASETVRSTELNGLSLVDLAQTFSQSESTLAASSPFALVRYDEQEGFARSGVKRALQPIGRVVGIQPRGADRPQSAPGAAPQTSGQANPRSNNAPIAPIAPAQNSANGAVPQQPVRLAPGFESAPEQDAAEAELVLPETNETPDANEEQIVLIDETAQQINTNANANADPNAIPELPQDKQLDQPVPETPPVVPPAVAPRDDEDTRALEELQEHATNAQAAENSAEDKSRALTNMNESAPDAPVDLNVTPDELEKSAKTVDEQKNAKPVVTAVKPNRKTLGFPDAEKAVRDMSNDLLDNLKSRGGDALYNRWRAYNASVRERTNSLQTGNELNSRCRLRWYESLYSDPLRSVGEVEKVSHILGDLFMGNGSDVLAATRLARRLTDVSTRVEHAPVKSASTPEEAIDILKAALVEAASNHAKSIAPLSQKDLDALRHESYPVFCSQVQSGHTIQSRGRGQYLVDALNKMNKAALYDAGEALMSVLDEGTLAQLAKIDFASLKKARISDDQIVGVIETEVGDILVGDGNRTVWELDRYPKVCCVIDLGGSDVYREGSCVLNRPVLFVLDFGQTPDEYTGKNWAIQGGALLGVSVWYDDGGNDKYVAKDLCQGSAIGGFGALINEGGDDKYLGFLRAQGTALGGFGVLIDRGGKDDYRAAMIAQGFGAPGGFGAIVDREGDDHYYVGGYYFDSYPEHPGYDGWGQGVGAGIRRVACGGVGMLLDGEGDDAYECDYFGHGGGYWMGVGVARDFGGNDIRYAATSTMYDGSARRERRWQRFGNGFGCHYAVGYLFDDGGDDVYGGTIMGVGMGWDLGAGFLVDFGGSDSFEATGGLTQGAGGEGSIGVIMNYRGDDVYYGNYQGYASGQLTYHAQSNCGANFSFVIDHGGKDTYGCRVPNNTISPRGGSTGMIVDRPSPEEERALAANPQQAQQQQRQAQQRQPQQQAQQTQQQQRSVSGYPAQASKIETMVAPPPLYDTNPHVTSSGTNAFNPGVGETMGTSTGSGGGFFGGGGFLRPWGNNY